jgi:hypothetical protein
VTLPWARCQYWAVRHEREHTRVKKIILDYSQQKEQDCGFSRRLTQRQGLYEVQESCRGSKERPWPTERNL